VSTTYENDLLNKRLERLTIVEYVGIRQISPNSNRKRGHWKCVCDCGKTVILPRSSLTRLKGGNKSCGCHQGNYDKLDSGEASFNWLYYGYKKGATRRNLSFNISKEFFRKLTKGTCYYCGIQPTQVIHLPTHNGGYTYNGVDRIDNNKGYEFNNVVTCCRDCNNAKRGMTVEQFIKWIERISKHILNKK